MSHVRVCFVCMGNICRSPTAEAVMAHRVAEAGLAERVIVESAGTGGWHVGEPPDRRATDEAARRGVAMRSTARQFAAQDFERFDLVVAMDGDNMSALALLAPDDAARAKLHLLRRFDPSAGHGAEVPDPYFGGPQGFADVFEMVDAACRGLLDHLRTTRLAG